MKVLVTGGEGMLAKAMLAELERRGIGVTALNRRELDVTDADVVRSTIRKHRPTAVVQCAAFTAVDDAELKEDEAFRVNAEGARNVAMACEAVSASFIYPSTDYVFDGSSTEPYRPDDRTAPLNAYGRSKLAGEEAAKLAGIWLVVRTSWLYGPGGPNFVETMLRLADREVIRVVSDQHGRPTSTRTLAAAIADLVERGATGTFHVTDGGQPTTWHGFAHAVLEAVGASHKLEPILTSDFPTPAVRPAYSVLDLTETEAFLGYRFADWTDSLRHHLRMRREEDR